MPYLIGTDEAGYGPFLGPLVIATSVWRVPDVEIDLAERFQAVKDSSDVAPSASPIVIDDSKRVYKRGRGLGSLEQSVLPALATTLPAGKHSTGWRDFWQEIAPGSELVLDQLPWYQNYQLPIPTGIDLGRIEEVTEELRVFWEHREVQLLKLQAVALFPEQFNKESEQLGGKGALLTHHTLALIRRQLETLEGEAVLIQCDKHGGRNHYAPALQHAFPEHLLEVCKEGRAQSVYRWGLPPGRREIRFTAKGDAFVPAALASMAAKYLRELAMKAFNTYWSERLPGLKPTAGYPLDARRFKNEIAALQAAEAIPDRSLWRAR